MRTAKPIEPLVAVMADLERRYLAGVKVAVLYAVMFAGRYGVPPPAWTAEPLAAALAAWSQGEAATLDKALGMKRPKTFRRSPHLRKHAVDLVNPDGMTRFLRVENGMDRLIAEGKTRTAASFEIGMKVGLDPRTTRRWYAEAKRLRKLIG